MVASKEPLLQTVPPPIEGRQDRAAAPRRREASTPAGGQKAALKWRQNRPFSANPERIEQRADSRGWYSDQQATRSPRPAARQVKGGRLKERFAKDVPCK